MFHLWNNPCCVGSDSIDDWPHLIVCWYTAKGRIRHALKLPDHPGKTSLSQSYHVRTGGRNSTKVLFHHLVSHELTTVCLSLCLLYTSDAADERSSVDLGGRRI